MDLVKIIKETKNYSSTEILSYITDTFENPVFTSSFGLEDQALTHMIADLSLNIQISTLDTGRLNQETYNVMAKTVDRYGLGITIYHPEAEAVESLVQEQGINGFYNSIDARKKCCAVRKLEPLSRALKNKNAWITGIRRDQSLTRSYTQVVELDSNYNIFKFNPLYDWSISRVWEYIHENSIPYNQLHDQGYPSIGCAPCTRAVKDGEDIRAGRWWWEAPEHKECGLHNRRT